MRSPLAEGGREALIEAILPEIAFEGWSRPALRAAARRAGFAFDEALALFPGGGADLVAEFSRWADRRMLDRLEASALDTMRVSERVAVAIGVRLDLVAPWREAVRRALSVLAQPQNAALAVRLLYETVDGIWYAAGDAATDFSFYTKRLTLAAIYGSAVLYWLDDRSEAGAATRAFLAKRLDDVARLGRARRDLAALADRVPNPLRLLRPLH
jgi:ubiquinone biosynthesis protein COQ9